MSAQDHKSSRDDASNTWVVLIKMHLIVVMLTYRIGDSLQYANKEFQVSYFDSKNNAVQNTT